MSTLRISIADMVSLGARTKGSAKSELPEFLYQCIPMKSATLMATLPPGPLAVSIPGERRSVPGYAISRTPIVPIDGFVIVYSRMPNRRYEAAQVRYRNSTFGITEFAGIATRWVEQQGGRLKAETGRYAYFAPSKEEWGCIQRDSGYTAWDCSSMPSEISPELCAALSLPDSSRVLARIPIFTIGKQPAEKPAAVFAQVEVAPEANANAQSAWIPYGEYRRIRSDRSLLPDSIVPDFPAWLKQFTEESGIEYWIFQPGMLLGDCAEWWGDGCRRRTEHEGIDFARGHRAGAGIAGVEGGVPVRSIADGEVAVILDDFIGKTVVIRHPTAERAGGEAFYTFMSHIEPLVAKQERIAKRQVVGKIGKITSTAAPMHLHLTGAWIPRSIAPDDIRLDHIHPAYAPTSLADFSPLMRNNPLCRFEKSSREEIRCETP